MQWLCLEKDARRPFPASPSLLRLRWSCCRDYSSLSLETWATTEVSRIASSSTNVPPLAQLGELWESNLLNSVS